MNAKRFTVIGADNNKSRVFTPAGHFEMMPVLRPDEPFSKGHLEKLPCHCCGGMNAGASKGLGFD
ncbi:hypothetical protein ACEUZ9_000392, partial [Paracoccus litorisediminis]|uniref:hypothetical protein n=1 Tax=Paracoccus litorisediminis TaxID=2006130 RepID=UPI003732BE5A